MKLIYVVIDGVSDLPVTELDFKTPLEYAETPNMDYLVTKGKLGLMYAVSRGIAPESDVAVISILGYDPFKYHAGRGPLEAYGAGLDMKNGDLALRCNFATIGEDKKLIDRRAGRDLTTEEAALLAKEVNQKVRLESHPAEFCFKNTLGHRGVLVIKSQKTKLSGKISNTDPAYERVAGLGVAKKDVDMVLAECLPMADTKAAKISAQLVNEFTKKSHRVLEKHEVNIRRLALGKMKANVILSRDAGDELPNFFNINERYKVRFACLADMPVERGISRLAGMDLVELPPPSSDIKSDMKIRVEKLLDLLQTYDCFYIHLKGPDEPGHDGDFQRKTKAIEDIDQYFFGEILQKIDLQETIICITADHSTPCILKSHSDDPVPLLIAGNKIKPDGLKKYSERSCREGSLGTIENGTTLMPMLMQILQKGS
ncbi:2,3-bisphosphoglycerate-independent phosphoglycerate mutase [Candidatus Bathyarchaeota archaeon]|nr:2,3-bisphosphoglycerate-independent phosphoglycerate mutase [Candidatus Bathyarchaeota archaeon]